MILATGPTGSGKTTTLYAILKLLNRSDINIMTIEDPVEYDIERVNQIQVNAKTGLTFAKGLRSIVRQDPDVVLVGEIRDEETADIAVNAAMTGHLVLSTLHTNDAATTMPRLLDMNVEPYLAASTINVVVAQRLVRKICLKCRMSEEKSVSELDKAISSYFPKDKKIRMYRGKGCQVCHQTGYIGRVGIYEVLLVDEAIRDAIMQKKNADEIHNLAVKNGMTTMVDDGMAKVKQGITTIEEVLRVARE
jgi:type IV pilus assembly protein PilB